IERQPERLVLDEDPELASDRLLRFRSNDLQAVDQRQTGLDAAHDDVDGIGEFLRKTLEPPVTPEADVEMGQQQSRGQAEPDGRSRAEASRDQNEQRSGRAYAAAHQ